jgi:hypothetical protein
MKRFLFAFLILAAATASAQTTLLGGRYSSYSTDITMPLSSVETGRGSSIGFIATYRNSGFVLNGSVDHDFNNGVTLVDVLPIDFGDYERDRGELTVGYSVAPVLDVEAGVRLDKISVGGIFSDLIEDLDFDHQAITGGITLHSPTIRPIGWYVSGHGYVGSADFQVSGDDVSDDTFGYKVEAGVPIPVGVSGWEITPGVEFERLETDKWDIEFETNRFFINFGYVIGR